MLQYTKDRRFHYVKRKKPNQRMKHYLAYEYLRLNTDENNTASANTIAEYISGEYGISAERRSVYKDIEELNTILYMLDNDITAVQQQVQG